MNILDANRIIEDFYDKLNPTKEDEILYVDALKYLIENYNDPKALRTLGGYYYGNKDFKLAEKYYLLAAEYNDEYAFDGLGYIYYYGRCGVVDYEKAFYYYQKASDLGVDEATIKLSDMYKKGLGVEKNTNKALDILINMYNKVKNTNNVYSSYPEVAIRLSNIYIDNNTKELAVPILIKAKKMLKIRLFYNPFFGEFTNMKSVIDYLYECTTFNKDEMDLYDLIYYFKNEGVVDFKYEGNTYKIIGVKEDDNIIIKANDKWYKSIIDYLMKEKIGDKRITSLVNDIYDITGE